MFKILATAFLLATTPVTGYECRAYEDVVNFLEQQHKENMLAWGYANAGGVVEVWGNAETWTIIVRDTRGRACIVAAGEGWRELAPILAGPDV